MSNSNYSIGLQRLKPAVHTAYCGRGTIWPKIGLGHETYMAETETRPRRLPPETETLTIFLETRPRRDVGTSRDRIESETPRPRPQPCRFPITLPYLSFFLSFPVDTTPLIS